MQTTYNFNPAVGMAGMKADAADDTVDTLANGDTVSIPPGVAVIKGSNDVKAVLPSSSSDKLLGVTVYSASGMTDLTQAAYAVQDAMSVMSKGRIFVQVEEAVTKNGPVYVRYASGSGGSQKGAFRTSADSSTALLAKGFRYLTSALSGGFAVVEVEIPAHFSTF